jgi:enoyl-CoA hydratase
VTDEEPAPGRIALDVDGEIATITIERPAKLNAIGPAMLAELEDRIAALNADRAVRAVILTGAGERAFCVGADVNAWSALPSLDMWRQWVREGHRVFERLERLRQPTIAAVNGFAFGGGLELALAADIRIAVEHAEFAMPETKIGTLPGWGGTRRLAATIGIPRAKQMIFSGARIDAVTAERWGLINEVVANDELMHRARQLARTIAENAPIAVQLAKAAIDGDPAALEAFAGALAAGTADGREGLAAFREKRAPQFGGK